MNDISNTSITKEKKNICRILLQVKNESVENQIIKRTFVSVKHIQTQVI